MPCREHATNAAGGQAAFGPPKEGRVASVYHVLAEWQSTAGAVVEAAPMARFQLCTDTSRADGVLQLPKAMVHGGIMV